MSHLAHEDEEAESSKLRTRIIPTKNKNRYGTDNKKFERINLTTLPKNLNFEKSPLISSEIHSANHPNFKKKSYIDNSFVRSSLKKTSYLENFKEARERMQYDRKLTEYLHEKPNIHKILKKYTTEISPIITEIHNVENFNDKNMIENISNSSNLVFLRKKYENFERKPDKGKIKQKSDYFFIKRNENTGLISSSHNAKDCSCDSDDNQSVTEATLDNLYKESMTIQKRILAKKNDGVGKRLKHFIKLQSIAQ